MSKASNQIDKIMKRLSSAVKEAVDRKSMADVGKFTVDLIVKRTRLGYGVSKNFSEKQKLAALSKKYILTRRDFPRLSPTTTPRKSNLTRTGQMLESLKFKYTGPGAISIEPTGTRDDGRTNAQIAQYNAEGGKGRPKRIFNRISRLEFNQAVRFYRKTFGDLLRRRNLIS